MPQPNQITAPQLMRLVGTPEAPAIVDVRLACDLAADPRLIPGSFHHRHDHFETPPDRLIGRRVGISCKRGKKFSAGVAALLRAQGHDERHDWTAGRAQ